MRRLRGIRLLAALLALLLIAAACTGDDDDGDAAGDDQAQDGGTDDGGDDQAQDDGADDDGGTADGGDRLAAVLDAGEVRCGTRDDLPGFATLDSAGDHVGFDADFCRVIAAAVLGDVAATNFVDLATDDRFTALQSGEVDVLVRNTTWTAGRDGNEGATFLQPNFYDGQGMMVNADAGFESVADLAGGVVCVAGGTTTEGNVATEFSRQGLAAPEVLSFESVDLLQQAFQEGRCDGWSSDRSQLTGLRSNYPEGSDALVILPETFSKEPLAPAVADGDTAWAQAVNWAILATIQAEEFGITSENVDEIRDTTEDPRIQQFLGVEVEGATLDPGLGLPTDFAYQVVSQVGNYGEIYERHIAPLGLERGLNSLWTDGGLLYAPPYR
ncbi:MAG TPA: amino acid ABC transporter substrate-binding protein [Acidimicrobiales bacterium]|nr:amino acid ABC transporter substrate-binding protein [Acidimicrobiales bacterium]